MASRPMRTNGEKGLWLTCRSADCVNGRKLEMGYFLCQHGIYMCFLLREMHLMPWEAFRFANYVCHPTDRLTEGGGSSILVRRFIGHNAVLVLRLRHVEEISIHVMSRGVCVLIFALLPVHLVTLVAHKIASIWEFHSSPTYQSSNREFRMKVSWCGEPFCSSTRQIHWPRVDSGRLKRKLRVTEVRRPVRVARKTVAKPALWIVPGAV
jgi:hypothetical protein